MNRRWLAASALLAALVVTGVITFASEMPGPLYHNVIGLFGLGVVARWTAIAYGRARSNDR